MSEVVEIKMHEDIDRISEQLRNSAFGAYINLEGIFYGVERIIGDTVSKIFKIILDKSKGRCFYIRVSLRDRETSKWDELISVICGSTIIAACGTIAGKEEVGSNIVSKIVEKINNKNYISAILEFIELPLNFPVKRFGVSIETVIEESPAVEEKKIEKSLISRETIADTPVPSPASTISIRSSMEKTQVLPKSVMKRFYQKILPRIPSMTRPREKSFSERSIIESMHDVLSYEKYLLKIMEEILDNTFSGEVNIPILRIRRGGERLLAEVNVTKLGLVMKREKMMKIATLIADLIKKIVNENSEYLKFKGVDVIVKHGWDLVKISR